MMTFVDYTLFMKVKLIECTHELDLEDEIERFSCKRRKFQLLIRMHYRVAMCFSSELEYSF
ncbi:sporulation protein Cse60 [Faecalibacillus intestinalis]|uniref:sporulation protein Cse60 n=1 Tax=Faecalibacillus intestinalis TaxID=1982626 RepID=UPI00351F99FE